MNGASPNIILLALCSVWAFARALQGTPMGRERRGQSPGESARSVKSYPSAAKRTDMVLSSLIGERVDVRLETVDFSTTLISLAVTGGMSAHEGCKGVAVALPNHALTTLRDAITSILTREL